MYSYDRVLYSIYLLNILVKTVYNYIKRWSDETTFQIGRNDYISDEITIFRTK